MKVLFLLMMLLKGWCTIQFFLSVLRTNPLIKALQRAQGSILAHVCLHRNLQKAIGSSCYEFTFWCVCLIAKCSLCLGISVVTLLCGISSSETKKEVLQLSGRAHAVSSCQKSPGFSPQYYKLKEFLVTEPWIAASKIHSVGLCEIVSLYLTSRKTVPLQKCICTGMCAPFRLL